KKRRIALALLRSNDAQIKELMASLERVVMRKIDRITIVPLFGTAKHLTSVQEAIDFVNFAHASENLPVAKYEIEVRYNNGDQIRGEFSERTTAIEFLRSFQ